MKIIAITLSIIALSSNVAFAHGKKTHSEKAMFVPANLDAVHNEFGQTGNPKKVTKTIHVTMIDEMKFVPNKLSVKLGDTVRFVVKNGGETLHEMVLGRTADLKKHSAMMMKFPGMEHSEPYMAHADEGQTAEIIWTFTKVGTFEYGCLIPGHYEAGMHGTVIVTNNEHNPEIQEASR